MNQTVNKNSDSSTLLWLHIVGPVRVVDKDSERRTPRGSKARALLVLLATSPTSRRNRQWIQDLLWSTRSPEQAQSSLRQSLSEIRRSLAPYDFVLVSDRHEVWLDVTKITIVDWEESQHSIESASEIAEGLITRDPSFDSWLTNLRIQSPDNKKGGRSDNTLASTLDDLEPIVYIAQGDTCQSKEQFVGEFLNNQIAKQLSHTLDLTLRIPQPNEDIYVGKNNSYLIRTNVSKLARHNNLSVQLVSLNDGSLKWCDQIEISSDFNDSQSIHGIYRAANQAAEETARAVFSDERLAPSNRHVQAILFRAINQIFSFEKTQLIAAEKLLLAAEKISDTPILRAWRCFLYLAMVMEGACPERPELISDAHKLSQNALIGYPDNAQVLGLLSQVELYLFYDVDRAARLARDSISINPGSPLAILSVADTELHAKDLSKARQLAYDALGVMSRSPHRHLWYLSCCYADITVGDYDSAINSAEAGLVYSPSYRAMLRPLYALYLEKGDLRKAESIAQRIKTVDPEFSLAMVRENDSYPAELLRKTGLAELLDVPELLIDKEEGGQETH